MYLHRTVEKIFLELSSRFKVVMLSGMRQVGKSTTLMNLKEPSRGYVTLENLDAQALARNAPKAFFEEHELPITIDEIQRAPNLFLTIKLLVDREETKGGVWLSGSQKFELMKGVGDSLAGRIYPQQLMPLSLYERAGKGLEQEPYVPDPQKKAGLPYEDADRIWDIIWQGGWPGALELGPEERNRYFNAFITTFLEKDVAGIWNVGKLAAYQRFMQGLALRTGQELRIGQLALIAGVDESTAKRWLSIAEASGLVYLLRPLSGNSGKTLTKSPKVYMTDVGLAAFLCRKRTSAELESDMNSDAFFETFVITEILKSWVHNGRVPDFYFYRDPKRQKTIDLIIHHEGCWHPVEIKSVKTPHLEMARNFAVLDKMGLNRGLGAIICNMVEKKRFLSDDVIAHSIFEI